ncbi:four-carbon acid sugar kinase family protein [Jiangella ureilytica]|uniref:four-carbon acid sugar kinase family protein n=1 Tax=Jiangella ureilytica TaxID=2530374 RepID=UPI00193E083F|nr:four-carbon acid sugar kinase family protein [Jiangella ureilytica]
MSALALGVVADDVTGACDLAGVVTAAGMPATVLLGPPSPVDVPAAGAACVVVALKTRTAPVTSAVAESVAAGRWLLHHGARRLYQKYCSTFDSTPAGNIGPVADALAELVGGRSVGTPATPAVGRTVYQGHLFVDGRLLSESPLRDHPLTPMTDADLVRVLGAQTERSVGLAPWPSAGVTPDEPAAHVLLDALTDEDLDRHAAALAGGDELLGGASGLAAALARYWVGVESARAGAAADSRTGPEHNPPGEGGSPPYGRAPTLAAASPRPSDELPDVPSDELPDVPPDELPDVRPGGGRVVLAGSCSRRTLEQIAAFPGPVVRIGVDDLAADPGGTTAAAGDAVLAALAASPTGPVLATTALPPEELRVVQRRHGRERAATLAEEALSAVARAVVGAGVRRLIIAGGETSGAVTGALGVRQVRVGAQVAPGVPWTVSAGPDPLALLLKSGNFGPADLFTTAWEVGP